MRFGRRTVVERLSFGVGRGELCAFLGRNGAGKTTTMRLLAGVLRPAEGSARIDGYDVVAERCAAASSIGFLPEATAGFSRLTVGEFLRFCGESRGLAGRTLGAAIDSVTERVHAREARDTLMGELSKGWPPEGVARTGAPARPSGTDPGRAHGRSRSGRAASRARAARRRLTGQGGIALDARARRGRGDCDPRHSHRAGVHRRRRRSGRSRRRTRPARTRVSPACRR